MRSFKKIIYSNKNFNWSLAVITNYILNTYRNFEKKLIEKSWSPSALNLWYLTHHAALYPTELRFLLYILISIAVNLTSYNETKKYSKSNVTFTMSNWYPFDIHILIFQFHHFTHHSIILNWCVQKHNFWFSRRVIFMMSHWCQFDVLKITNYRFPK